jgi:hypothetical protein
MRPNPPGASYSTVSAVLTRCGGFGGRCGGCPRGVLLLHALPGLHIPSVKALPSPRHRRGVVLSAAFDHSADFWSPAAPVPPSPFPSLHALSVVALKQVNLG